MTLELQSDVLSTLHFKGHSYLNILHEEFGMLHSILLFVLQSIHFSLASSLKQPDQNYSKSCL